MQTQKFKGEDVKILDLTPSCKNCDRIPVCGIFRAIQPLMGQWDAVTRPFEAEKLAIICKHFAGGC